MTQGTHLIEQATVTNRERARELRRRMMLADAAARARPSLGVRRRVGHRLIAVGERMAYGRSQTATR